MKRNDILKWIALLTMTIDHIGLVLFPKFLFLRIIGRIAFPIFAYQLAVGFRKTSNRTRYALRLAAFSFVSQPVYSLIHRHGLNIGFTLLAAFFMLFLWEIKNPVGKLLAIVWIAAIFFFGQPLEYGFYGIALIFCFYIFDGKPKETGISIVLLNLFYGFDTRAWIQLYSLFTIPLIYKEWKQSMSFPKWLFYVYYPLHLLVLYSMKRFL